jgi:hypothetical protein
MMKSTKILAVLLGLCVIGLGAMGMWVSQLQDQHRSEVTNLKSDHQRAIVRLEDQHKDAFVALQDKHAKEVQVLTEDFEKKLDVLRKDQRQKMASAFTEFQSIFDGNKKTIDYINALEGKVKSGQAVSKGEVEKLAVIATGLGYLQKQYQKPFQEFKELESYLAKKTSGNQQKPTSNFGFFKRMFDKDFREAERAYERNEGARQAFVDAQSKFSTVYNAAQRQMAGVGINAEAYTKKLYELIDEKQEANREDLSKFFDQARQALKTHQDVLDFQPEKLDLPTKPQP